MDHLNRRLMSIELYRRFVLPKMAQPYVVTEHQIIAKTVHHVSLQPQHGEKISHVPGQFLMIQFRSAIITPEWHPFTISSAPSDSDLTVSMKESGDWTATLGQLTVGTTAHIAGPYGEFSYHFLPKDNLGYVFIAGGIGITPLRSMIRELCHVNTNRPLTLLYNARSLADFAFKDEFDTQAQQHSNLKVVYITSQEKTNLRFGRIDANFLHDEVSNITEQHYYICGPKPMMTAVRKTLHQLGVSKRQIHFEEFSLT